MFDVEYQVDESCLRFLVPHLILQPLVENAVYHGIKPMGGNGAYPHPDPDRRRAAG